MKDYNSKIGILVLSSLKGVGPVFIKSSLKKDTFQSHDNFKNIVKLLQENNRSYSKQEILDRIDKANEIIHNCDKSDISIIDFTSETYPAPLKEIKDPPPVLYCKGNLDLLYHKTICIIGTRESTKKGSLIASKIGSYFADSGWSICNGLAEGIDISSIKNDFTFHSKVIGVLAGGLDYNSSNTLLNVTALNADKVYQNRGLLVSENPPMKKEDTFSVVKSCRIQAALSKGLILIQSSLKGGSRFTVKTLCEVKRPLGVIHPIISDYDLKEFEANKEIIENRTKGLAKFTEIKEDKVKDMMIYILKSKDDYQSFEKILQSCNGLKENLLF